MQIPCPGCAHRIRFENAQPGQYALKCPKCAAALRLKVPTEPDQPPELKLRPAPPAKPRPAQPAGSEKPNPTPRPAPSDPPGPAPARAPRASRAEAAARPGDSGSSDALGLAAAGSSGSHDTVALATAGDSGSTDAFRIPGAGDPGSSDAVTLAAASASGSSDALSALPAARPASGSGSSDSDDDWLNDLLTPGPTQVATQVSSGSGFGSGSDVSQETIAQTAPAASVAQSRAGGSSSGGGGLVPGSPEFGVASTEVHISTPAGGPKSAKAGPVLMSEMLGGYKILRQLGKGGMGSVYLAQQLSLGRNVALKVMSPKLSSNPTFVARFTREAYAAAQLLHHNIVQIYEFGEDKSIHYFSMEYVQGETLAELIKKQGPLEPARASGYVLQAARGLKFAHDLGLIHRDIKPDNLMLNPHGLVKVADLGLVKAIAGLARGKMAEEDEPASAEPGEEETLPDFSGDEWATRQVTLANMAMGTPAFMAPEQAQDAANVDGRADIYSLGCTYYSLVTGRPPFEGKSALELITKHASEPVTPPQLVVSGVPNLVSVIILKMVAKEPAERYANMDELIEALETLLGISSAEPTLLRNDEVSRLEQIVSEFRPAASVQRLKGAFVAFEGACAAGVVLALVQNNPLAAGAAVGLGAFTPVAYLVLDGMGRDQPLGRKIRQYYSESSRGERTAVTAGLVLAAVVLLSLKMLWVTLGLAAAATVLASLARKVIGPTGEEDLQGPVEHVQELLRSLRLRGLDEAHIRRFVAERAGPRWDGLQAALFGPEARLASWQRWGSEEWARTRPKLHALRDTVFNWVDARLRARQEARARQHLQRVEEESLRAQGINTSEARRKARAAAEAMVAQASVLRAASIRASRSLVQTLSTREGHQRLYEMFQDAAEKPDRFLNSMEKKLLARRSDESLNALIGPRTRFIAGVVLIFGYLLWLFQNSLHTDAEGSSPLWLPLVPSFITRVFRDANSGIAGLFLIASALFAGWRVSILVIPAAAIALLGYSLGLSAWLCLIIALVLAALGFTFGRTGTDTQLSL